MSEAPRLAVVGCGIFGAEVALRAAESGYEVTVFERAPAILSGASRNNQNRLHLGFHYPRDLETGRQSIRGYRRFVERYPHCVDEGFRNAYFIADEGSLTTPEQFLAFCERLGMPYRPIRADEFPMEVTNAATGVLCGEGVYDCGLLRDTIAGRLAASGVDVRLATEVASLRERGDGVLVTTGDGRPERFDAVANCAYADINRLTAQLGHVVQEREYEYTVVPIVRANLPRAGMAVLDGPFMTLLPHGKGDEFLLYHVVNTVVARTESRQLDPRWRQPATSPFAGADRDAFFEAMREACATFVPGLRDATMVGCLEGPRMVLARNHATDARPSLLTSYGPRYHTVFSGKIDHCVWIADELVERMDAGLGRAAA
jgi:glycine/D-amino acid oxidase-like deaminating enzyme